MLAFVEGSQFREIAISPNQQSMSTNVHSFFSNLNAKLVEARQQDQQRLQQFFEFLNPKLVEAREADRKHARRFNSFDYMVTSELGLSKIIADLLDPKANHGQGPLFLKTFLMLIEGTSNWSDLDLSNAKVSKEIRIYPKESSKDFRQIDIVVEIPNDDGNCFLIIENKPYSEDQKDQLREYLKHYERKRSLLIYAPPKGKLPSEKSISRDKLASLTKGNDINRFAIMPYYWKADLAGKTDQTEKFRTQLELRWEDFHVGCSLIDWLVKCREQCGAERLYWFLDDAVKFCQREFGGLGMASNSEIRAVQEFLLSDSKNLETAELIYNQFPYIKDKAIKSVADALLGNVKKKLQSCNDLKFYSYKKEGKEILLFAIYKTCWPKFENTNSFTKGRIAICMGLWLDFDSTDPNLYWGVYAPNPDTEKNRVLCSEITERCRKESIDLPEENDKSWLLWKNAKEEYNDVRSVIIKLLNESKSKEASGDTMDYFVANIVSVVEKADSILNEFNGQ